MLFRARQILPITAPPLEDGAVFVSNGTILGVGPWRDLRARFAGPAIDFGEVLLAPGFVNAHCHLEYTHLAGRIPSPASFTDWVRALMAARSAPGPGDASAAWLAGAGQLLSTGTTTLANIESTPAVALAARHSTPLRVVSFLEMTGVLSGEAPELLVGRMSEIARQLDRAAPGSAGLSPHAPYSTAPALPREAARVARQHGWRLTTHVAESREEFDMFVHRRGPLHDWLSAKRPMDDGGPGSPLEQLSRQGLLGADFLAVHANELTDADVSRLASSGTHVVHCPRTHAYFRRTAFDRNRLDRAGVNLCLGTDSLASMNPDAEGAVPTLSMGAELRALLCADPHLSPTRALEMATVCAARALGLPGQAGELCEGSRADFHLIPASSRAVDAPSAVIGHVGTTLATFVDGKPAWLRPGYELPHEH